MIPSGTNSPPAVIVIKTVDIKFRAHDAFLENIQFSDKSNGKLKMADNYINSNLSFQLTIKLLKIQIQT